VTRKAFAAAGNPEGTTTRTNDAFMWPQGAGIMMLDHDPRAGAEAMGRDDLVARIRKAAPGLAGAAMLWWPSASSCIHADGRELRGVKGQRLFIIAADIASATTAR